MDLSSLVSTVVAVLAPFLPYLTKVGEQAAEEVGKHVKTAAGDLAKALWRKIWPKVEDQPAAQDAVESVAQNPEDEDALGALRLQLKKLLAEDAGLAQEIAGMVQAGAQAGVIVIASGDHSKAAGRDIIEIKMK